MSRLNLSLTEKFNTVVPQEALLNDTMPIESLKKSHNPFDVERLEQALLEIYEEDRVKYCICSK